MSELGYVQLHTARGIGPATMRRVLARLNQINVSLDEFLDLPSGEQVARFGLAHQQAEALYAAREEAERVYDELQQKEIALLTLTSPGYPPLLQQRLGEKSPLVLYVWGNPSLLERRAVGFCGARDASEKGISVAEDCATQLADWGWVVVSGGARGVDTATHRAVLEAGGNTVIVLPEGILKYRLRQELRSLVSESQVLVVSEFSPNTVWSASNAMQRNRTICGLSEAMIVIESGTSGGTFEAGKVVLRLKMLLFIADYAEPSASASGNAYFINHGARPLRRNAESGRANLEPLRRAVENGVEAKPIVVQERLF